MNHPYLLAGLAAFAVLAGPLPARAAQDPAPVAAPDADRLAIAQDIVRIGFPPELRREMMRRTSDTLMAQMREGMLGAVGRPPDPELERLFNRYWERLRTVSNQLSDDGTPAIFEAMARAYARQFSREDLAEIRAFVATQAGSRFFRQSPELLADPDVAAANRAHMERTMEAMMPLLEEARRDMEAYAARPAGR